VDGKIVHIGGLAIGLFALYLLAYLLQHQEKKTCQVVQVTKFIFSKCIVQSCETT
jgi:NhaP-type Na+/H+ or K+/H+ antiporter